MRIFIKITRLVTLRITFYRVFGLIGKQLRAEILVLLLINLSSDDSRGSVTMDHLEFSELCRICGSKTSVLMGLHIFEKEGDMRQIYKKITECLPIQVRFISVLLYEW